MSFQTDVINHATGIDLKINGSTVLALTEGGVTRTGADYSWSQELFGKNFAVGGSGALDEAVITIGTYRKYNAFEFVNSSTPYLDVNFWLPPDYDGSALLVTLYFVKTATATGTDIVTRIRLGCIGEADSLDVTISNPTDITTTTAANNCLFTVAHTVTPLNAADGGLCHGIVQRIATAVADDYTGSAYLIGARVEYA